MFISRVVAIDNTHAKFKSSPLPSPPPYSSLPYSLLLSPPFQLQTLDNEGRCVMTEHALEECGSGLGGGGCGLGSSLVVVNLYCPRVDADNQSRLEYQYKFYEALIERCTAMRSAGKYVVCGDEAEGWGWGGQT